jgi:starch synthase
MKGGIAGADWITTVSPTYAEEIQTAAFGCGLEGLLQYRADHLTGILNGMDCEIWNPATDRYIKRNYDAHSLQYKSPNKSALQRQQGLPVKPGHLLFGHIGRLVEQKGVDLILDILDQLFTLPVQLVVLGSGDSKLEDQLALAVERYPQQLAIHIGYDEQLAHRIKAGADCFLMPSRYEPCGLNQMYSLRYGTVPIVHRTGGLADTVTDLNLETATSYTATGFSFDTASAEQLLSACTRAHDYFRNSRVDWWKLVISGMKENFCWSESAGQYLDLYIHTCNMVRAGLLDTGGSEYLAM